MRIIASMVWILLCVTIAVWLSFETKSRTVTALAFFYLGFSFRPDINIAWRYFNQKLDAWVATPKGML